MTVIHCDFTSFTRAKLNLQADSVGIPRFRPHWCANRARRYTTKPRRSTPPEAPGGRENRSNRNKISRILRTDLQTDFKCLNQHCESCKRDIVWNNPISTSFSCLITYNYLELPSIHEYWLVLTSTKLQSFNFYAQPFHGASRLCKGKVAMAGGFL